MLDNNTGEQADDKTAIRPFRVNVPEAELTELRRRINATKWPERETVTDQSQGVQLAPLQELARYWGTDYDWRKCEAKLNALPQFITEIDGLDIHFVHVRSKHENALPLIVTHGWPGSIIEQLKIIEPLTNPTAHDGSASDAFDVVIPSMPGYGFSGKPTTNGWEPAHIARAWVVLMKRLGYTQFVASGGDWSAARRLPIEHTATTENSKKVGRSESRNYFIPRVILTSFFGAPLQSSTAIPAPCKCANRSRARRPNSVSRWRKLIHGQERAARASRMNCLMH